MGVSIFLLERKVTTLNKNPCTAPAINKKLKIEDTFITKQLTIHVKRATSY